MHITLYEKEQNTMDYKDQYNFWLEDDYFDEDIEILSSVQADFVVLSVPVLTE